MKRIVFTAWLLILATISLKTAFAQAQTPKYLFKGIHYPSITWGYYGCRYDYSQETQLKSVSYYIGDDSPNRIDSIHYNQQGLIEKIDKYFYSCIPVYPLPLAEVVSYSYSESGDITVREVEDLTGDNKGLKSEFFYDEKGNNIEIKTTYDSGKVSRLLKFFNDKNLLVKEGITGDNGDELVSNIKNYEYDEQDNLVKVVQFTDKAEKEELGRIEYVYDGKKLMEKSSFSIENGVSKLMQKNYLFYDDTKEASDIYYPKIPFYMDSPIFAFPLVNYLLETGKLRIKEKMVNNPNSTVDQIYVYLYDFQNPDAVDQISLKEPIVSCSGNSITIEGYQMKRVSIYSVDGTLLYDVHQEADKMVFPMLVANQVYLIRVTDASGHTSTIKTKI